MHLQCGETPHKFEVESKFRVPPGFEKLAETKGAKLLQKTSFTDVYFDTVNHELTLTGRWLRKRDSKWELKIQKLKNDLLIESNCEIEDEGEIVNELLKTLPARYSSIIRDCSSVEDVIQSTCCKQIASFTTHRTVFEMPNGVLIDLDQASFGYQIGELEVVVANEKDIELAKETIQKTARLLGMHRNVHNYFYDNCRNSRALIG